MARAKRTDRAEARRKYRAYLQAQEDAGIAEDEGSDSSADSGRKPARRTVQDVQPLPGARLGIFAAAKGAYRQAHYIDDIKSLPQLIFRSNAIWPVVVICVVAGGYAGIRFQSSDWRSDSVLMALLSFIFIPPIIPPMLAGFLAPRATWLAGAIASLMATLVLVGVLAISSMTVTEVNTAQAGASPSISPSAVAAVASASTSPSAAVITSATPVPTTSPAASAAGSASPSASPSAANTGTTGSNGSSTSNPILDALQMLFYAFSIGAGVGALSGWYKRFLALTSGPGKPRSPKSGGQRSAQRRRPATTRK